MDLSDFDIGKELNLGDGADAVFIDMERIDAEAENDSTTLCNNLEKIYGNREFMDAHPDYKKRLDIEIENLRVLIKMKMSDESVHDIAVKAIAANPSNASMYQSLIKVQSSLLDIQKRTDDVVKNINTLLKGYQTELNFDEFEDPTREPENNGGSVVRGTRAFIQEMNKGTNNANNIIKLPAQDNTEAI